MARRGGDGVRANQAHKGTVHLGNLRNDGRACPAGDDENVVVLQSADEGVVEGNIAL